ncbi:MAG TPA: VOC family protein [Acidimicrobiales bacterium]|nr:VOC family protein [Acidimicrobiales bacterium]
MFLEHVNLTVSDLDRSVAFYCDLLDLEVRWKGAVDANRLGAHVGDDRCYLALFQATADGAVEHDYLRPGVNHFGFVVDDLDATRRRAIELGATFHLEADYEPGRRAYFMDPDGYEVELVEY